MQVHQPTRESGSSMLMLVLPLTFLLALAGAMTTLTSIGLQTTTRSSNRLVSYYAADAGAQIGNALVRSTGLSMQSTSFETMIDDHPVIVGVEFVSTGVYKVTSSSEVNGEPSSVELWVTIDQEEVKTAANAGFEVTVGDSARFQGDLKVVLEDDSVVSGFDHDVGGAKTDDQSDAVPAFGVHENPDGNSFNVEVNDDAVLEAHESYEGAISNEISEQTELLNKIRDNAKEHADVLLSGDTELDTSDSKDFGSMEDPVIAYVSLDHKDSLVIGASSKDTASSSSTPGRTRTCSSSINRPGTESSSIA